MYRAGIQSEKGETGPWYKEPLPLFRPEDHGADELHEKLLPALLWSNKLSCYQRLWTSYF